MRIRSLFDITTSRTGFGMTLAATVMALSPLAHAAGQTGTASASISNVHVSASALDAEPWVTGNWPWFVQNTGPGWPATAESSRVSADLSDAGLHDGSIGWIGTSRSASVGSADNFANASISFSGADLSAPGSASAVASAKSGEVASASASLWDSPFMVGARSRINLTFTVDSLSAFGAGGTASALVKLGIWDENGGTNASFAEAQAIDSPFYTLDYTGPFTLSVSWDNPSLNLAVAHVSLLTSAQVISTVAAPVPEPTSAALLLAGLAVVAGHARRRAGTGAAGAKR